MKKIVLIIGICFLLVVGGLLLFNKSFLHDYYEVTNAEGQKAQISALQFSFFAGEPEKHTAVFYRIGNQHEMQDQLNHYVESLTSCYDDGAFCDTEQNFTIYSYQVAKGILIHKITLIYDTIDLKDIENGTGVDIQTLVQDGKKIGLQPGDSYVANEWAGTPEYRLNQTYYDSAAVTGQGITTGVSLGEVTSAYSVKNGFGLWELRTNSKSDGTFLMESREFKSGTFDATDVQKARLIIAYYKLEGQWIPLTYEEINQYIGYLSGESTDKPYDGIIMFQFEFPFNGYSERVADRILASFSLDYK